MVVTSVHATSIPAGVDARAEQLQGWQSVGVTAPLTNQLRHDDISHIANLIS